MNNNAFSVFVSWEDIEQKKIIQEGIDSGSVSHTK